VSDLEKAISIAVEAHNGQFDKGGNPYVLHSLRVMMALKTDDEMIVGVLHDVVEDCSEKGFGWARLQHEGFSETVLDALRSVTKTPEEETQLKLLAGEDRTSAYLRFVSRAKGNEIGRNVKRSDINDNLNVTRMGSLNEKDLQRLNQYKRALQILDTD
jgi:(p)ppGpp synthase/HD superfamily hydrolase